MSLNNLLSTILVVFLPIFVLKAQDGSPMGAEKPFQVSAEIRTEYDTNINTTTEADEARGESEEDSMKLIFMPQLLFRYPLEQTEFSFSYDFGLVHYLDRSGDDDQDLEHDFIGQVTHSFTPQFDIEVRERFKIDQRPQIDNTTVVNPLRSNSDRLTNRVSATANYAWTDRFSTATTYENYWLNYKEGTVEDNDRMEHTVIQDFRFQAARDTTAIAGYQYVYSDYDRAITGTTIEKDNESHIFTLGGEHYLTPQWLIAARAGAEMREFDNAAFDDSITPFGSLSTVWNYDPRSSVSLLYFHRETSADSTNFGGQTADQVLFTIKHYLTPKLSLGSSVTAIVSEFDSSNALGGTASVDELVIRTTGDIEYEFNEWLSFMGGYRFSETDSDDSARSFDRHQGYLGIRGIY